MGKVDVMNSKLDGICTKILLTLINKDYLLTYADIQREVGTSYKTVRNHIGHLEEKELVSKKKRWKGQKYEYEISLTEIGKDLGRELTT